jgi:arabinogalactan endo-1,4-beta-galactosidase
MSFVQVEPPERGIRRPPDAVPARRGSAAAASGLAFLIGLAAGLPARADFIAGADFSHLAYFESQGIVYKTGGVQGDALEILRNQGVTCVRLRLFTSSAVQAQADPYNYINNLDYTVPLAVRVKNAGLQLALDFHYSDTWADPGHQAKPAAWSGLTFSQLVQQMRAYNSNCIVAFKAAGAMPDYVQIGNEITGGMLWPDGRVPGTNASTQWPKLAQLMTAAIEGIQDAAGAAMPRIIVHIDRGADWGSTKWYFDNLITTQHVRVDIIGESYYPYWHGTLSNLNYCLTNTAKRYGKPVMIAETDFPWIYSTNIFGIPASTNGQVEFVATLARIVRNVPDNLGAGIIWWGTEYQLPNANAAGFGTRSFFDSSGNVMPVAGSFGQLVAPLVLNASVAGSDLTLSWPLSGAGLTLKSATHLSPSAWLPVTNAVQTMGAVFRVVLPQTAEDSVFFRLHSN